MCVSEQPRHQDDAAEAANPPAAPVPARGRTTDDQDEQRKCRRRSGPRAGNGEGRFVVVYGNECARCIVKDADPQPAQRRMVGVVISPFGVGSQIVLIAENLAQFQLARNHRGKPVCEANPLGDVIDFVESQPGSLRGVGEVAGRVELSQKQQQAKRAQRGDRAAVAHGEACRWAAHASDPACWHDPARGLLPFGRAACESGPASYCIMPKPGERLGEKKQMPASDRRRRKPALDWARARVLVGFDCDRAGGGMFSVGTVPDTGQNIARLLT